MASKSSRHARSRRTRAALDFCFGIAEILAPVPTHRLTREQIEALRVCLRDAKAEGVVSLRTMVRLLAFVTTGVLDTLLAAYDAAGARQHPKQQTAPPLLSVSEVAKRLRVSTRTVERMIALGELNTIRIGHRRGVRRVSEAELARVIAAGS